jgi:acetyl-CoA C-acetyltransferase
MSGGGVWIAGSYQSDYARNYAREGLEISDMVAEAVAGTLDSANIDPADVEAIHVGNAFGQLGRSLTTTVSFVVTRED